MAESSTVGQRIAQLIQQLGLSKNAFAISLDKTATVIQHLVEERNKPGFDLLCKIFEVYPNVSKSWLMQGTGSMWSDEVPATPASIPVQNAAVAEPSVPQETVAPAEPTVAALPEPATAAASPAPIQAPVVPVAEPVVAAEAVVPPAMPFVAPVMAVPIVAATPEPTVAAAAAPLMLPVAAPQPAPVVPVAPAPDAAAWQSALYTQQMAHQLALAELRNQHMQEQQRLMQQMMDLMQRQLAR